MMRGAWMILLIWCCVRSLIFAQCNTAVEAGNDTSLCQPGGAVLLQGMVTGDHEFVEWMPATGLSDPNSLTPTANVTATTTYVLSAYGYSNNNLIVNGDFEAGNTGFTSQYMYSPNNLVPEGAYAVLPDPSTAHPSFPACTDHTFMNGTGNMMAINGAGTPNTEIWCQTIVVNPNTYYEFNTWVVTLISSSPAQLQFSVNNELLGPVFTAPTSPCVWAQFNENWFSGNNTTAEICIVNQNTSLSGNDFALDDISFFEYCDQSDSVTVEILPITESDIDTLLCNDECLIIGGTSYCLPGSYTHILTGANQHGCDSVVNINIQKLNPQAVILTPEPLSCFNQFEVTLNGSFSSQGSNVDYVWTGPNGFFSPLINPTVTDSGTYILEVIMTNDGVFCIDTTSVYVPLYDDKPNAQIEAADTLTCSVVEVLLDATGSSSSNSLLYTWQDSNGNPFSLSAVVTTDMSGLYYLIVTDALSGCTDTASVQVYEDRQPPILFAIPDTLSCVDSTATLVGATDSPSTELIWRTPEDSLQMDSIITVSVPGEYVLYGTAANGCVDSLSIEVAADTVTPVFSLPDSVFLSCNDSFAVLAAPMDSIYYDFIWQGDNGFSDTGRIIMVSAYGSYELSLRAANGCVGSNTTIVAPDTAAPVLFTSGDTLTCTDTIGYISVEAQADSVEFLWTGPFGFYETGAIVPVHNAGDYQVMATASNGCVRFQTVSVVPSTDIPPLTAEGDTLTCTDSMVTLRAIGPDTVVSLQWTGPHGYFSELWSPTVQHPGQYTISIMVENGCSNELTVVVDIDTIHPEIEVADSLLSCAILSLTPSYETNISTDQIRWTSSQGFDYTGVQPIIDQAGLYSATAVSSNGCATRTDFSIGIDTAQPTADVYVDTLTCSSPTQRLQGFYQPPTSQVRWSGPHGFQSSESFPSFENAGLYEYALFDSLNGCRDTMMLSVGIDTMPPSLLVQSDTITCDRSSATLQASESMRALAFQWSGPNGFSSMRADTVTQVSGLYQLTATAANGCTDSTMVVVPIDTVRPITQIRADTIRCNQPVISVSTYDSSQYAYFWEGPSGFMSDMAVFPTSQSGLYRLSVRSNNGCERMDSIYVPIDTVLPQIITQDDTLSCSDTSIVLQASTSASRYHWLGPGGFFSTILQVEVDAVGDYILTATADNGCTNIDTLHVVADQSFPMATVSGGTLSCAVTSVTLQSEIFTADVTSIWKGPHGFTSTQSSPLVSEPGIYQLLVTSPNGCVDSFATHVLLDTISPIIDGVIDTLTCAHPAVTFQASVMADSITGILWSGPNGFVSSLLEPEISVSGIYQLNVTDSNGCSADMFLEVVENIQLPIVAISPDTLTCTHPTVDINAQSASDNYSYRWTHENGFLSTRPSPMVTASGVYQLLVTNLENGCMDSLQAFVAIDTVRPDLQAMSDTITCSDTIALLNAASATGDLDFEWTGPNGFLSFTAQAATSVPGIYTVTVTALNGCISSSQTTVTSDTVAPELEVTGLTLNCLMPFGHLYASVGSDVNVSWWLSGNAIGYADSLEIQTGGDYRAIATGDNGCESETWVQVLEDFEEPHVETFEDSLTCASLIATLSSTSTDLGATFEWSGPDGYSAQGDQIVVNQAGIYTVLVTGSNGCTSTAIAQAWADTTAPVALAHVAGVLNCVTEMVDLSSAASVFDGAVEYEWRNPYNLAISYENNAVAEIAGWHVLLITYTENQCTGIDSIWVIENPAMPSSVSISEIAPSCPGGRGSLHIEEVQGGTPPYVYSVDGSPFAIDSQFTSLPEGTHLLTIRDSIGCTYDAEINIPDAPTSSIDLPPSIRIQYYDSAQLLPKLDFPISDIESIQWSPPLYLSCADCLEPVVSGLPNSMLYELQITKEGGCSVSGHIFIEIDKDRQVHFPNVFSPHNGDGHNDYFYPIARTDDLVSIRRLTIANRWGELVFEQLHFQPNDYTKGWDGIFRGMPLHPGVYVYYAEVEFVDGAILFYKGNVTLVR